MTDSPVAERQEEIPAPSSPVPVSPGVGRLLHGKREEEIPVAPKLRSLPLHRRRMLRRVSFGES